MREQPPQKTALQIVGVLAGSASVLYFVFANRLGLSPVTTAAVGLLVAVGLAAASLVTPDPWDTVSLYLLAGVSFLGASVRLVQAYSLGDAGFLLALLTLTAIALGLSRRWGRLAVPSRRVVRAVLLTSVIFSAAIVGVDLGTADVSHSVEVVGSVGVGGADGADGPTEPIRLGTVTYRNPSPIPKRAGYPDYEACLVGVDLPDPRVRETRVSVDYYSDRLVPGGGSPETELTVRLPREATNATATYAVVRTDACPDSAATPTIAVYERGDR